MRTPPTIRGMRSSSPFRGVPSTPLTVNASPHRQFTPPPGTTRVVFNTHASSHGTSTGHIVELDTLGLTAGQSYDAHVFLADRGHGGEPHH